MRVRFPDGHIEERDAAELRQLGNGALQMLEIEVTTRDPFEPTKAVTWWANGRLLGTTEARLTGRAAVVLDD